MIHMVFIRIKWIPSGKGKRPYLYLVRSYRKVDKVNQKVIKYLGSATLFLDLLPEIKRLFNLEKNKKGSLNDIEYDCTPEGDKLRQWVTAIREGLRLNAIDEGLRLDAINEGLRFDELLIDELHQLQKDLKDNEDRQREAFKDH